MSEQGWHVHPDGYAHDDSLSQCLAIGCLPLTFDRDDLARLASETRALAESKGPSCECGNTMARHASCPVHGIGGRGLNTGSPS